jgi:hypothetical protein
MERMSIIWSSEPNARLQLWLLRYGSREPVRRFSGSMSTGWTEKISTLFGFNAVFDFSWRFAERRFAYDTAQFMSLLFEISKRLDSELQTRMRALDSYKGDQTRADQYAEPIWRDAVAAVVTAYGK